MGNRGGLLPTLLPKRVCGGVGVGRNTQGGMVAKNSAIISGKMSTRLIIAIVTTILEEAAIAAVFLWGLPKLGVDLPIFVMVIIMVAWLGYAVFTYRMGSRALRKKPVAGLMDMVGSKGEVAKRLDPEGMVRIKGELWQAKSDGGDIDSGEEVTVVGQEGLKLIVRKGD
jgi:membrane-bound ClpP family serine protease